MNLDFGTCHRLDIYVNRMETKTSQVMSTLSVGSFDSPGSSVFDLPIQNSLNPQAHPKLTTQSTSHSGGNLKPFPSFVVISGGSGGNAICAAFGNACHYVLPVSDDGGSSSEIIRVLGGPSIGMADEPPFVKMS
jgi:hypothetical protein